MNHSLLKNKVYLYLLSFYNNKSMPSYVKLSNKIGLTRQTVSKKIKELLKNNIITIKDDGVLIVTNEMELDEEELKNLLIDNPNISAVELEKKLFSNENKEEIMSNLNISYGNYYDQQKTEVVVYGIVSEGIIKYVGSTKQYSERIKQHIRKRPFLTGDSFVILKKVEDNMLFNYEKQLIKILQPEWNIVCKD